MPILKVGGKIVRVGGKLVTYPANQKWYAVIMVNYPEGKKMCAPSDHREFYAGAVTSPNLPYAAWSSQEELEAAYGTFTVEGIPIGGYETTPLSVCTHGANYKDRVWNYFRTPGPNTPIEFASRAAAIAHGVAQGYPAIPNRWDSAGSNWQTVSGYSNPVTPWVRHMYKLTTKNWEYWSDNSNGYVQEVVSLVCVNEPQVGWSTDTSWQDSFEYEVEEGVFVTVYNGTLFCYEYLGLMSFDDGVAEIGASMETLMGVAGYNNNFIPAFYCGVSENWYMPSAPIGTTSPTPAEHLILTGCFNFIDSRGCALAPIQECPAATPATAIGYVIYDTNDTAIASGSALRTGWAFAIHLNPNLASSIDTIKLSFTLDESDRTFNSFVYKVNSVKINNTATPKLDGTYSYTMEIPATHSLGTIEIFRRYIIKTT